ncbi:MAG: hypothetical protein K1X89_06260 [Myxococcaceae bacterium]|nr:hypothetical protein [Myxococcaceae bacterium]
MRHVVIASLALLAAACGSQGTREVQGQLAGIPVSQTLVVSQTADGQQTVSHVTARGLFALAIPVDQPVRLVIGRAAADGTVIAERHIGPDWFKVTAGPRLDLGVVRPAGLARPEAIANLDTVAQTCVAGSTQQSLKGDDDDDHKSDGGSSSGKGGDDKDCDQKSDGGVKSDDDHHGSSDGGVDSDDDDDHKSDGGAKDDDDDDHHSADGGVKHDDDDNECHAEVEHGGHVSMHGCGHEKADCDSEDDLHPTSGSSSCAADGGTISMGGAGGAGGSGGNGTGGGVN